MTEPQNGTAATDSTGPRRARLWLISIAAVIVMFVSLPFLLKLMFGFGWWRVQILRSADRQHVAELERLYGGIDGMFSVTLDGRQIHRSWDCRPTETIPFRETLAWDTTGNILVFELAGEIVFAYDVPSQAEIPPSRFDEIVVPKITLKDIGFEGRDELQLQKQDGPKSVAAP